MKKLIILCVTIILVSSIVSMVMADTNGPPEVKYTPKMGTVTFAHAAHQALTVCATCHHTGDYAQCKSCHGIDPNAPAAKDVYHKQCKECHNELKKGPTKCKECHIK